MQGVLTALAATINNPARAAPLWGLAYIKYGREMQPCTLPDGTIALTLSKWGWEYKHRGPRPKTPAPADTEGIKQALNTALAPRLTVRAVTDRGESIEIIMEELK